MAKSPAARYQTAADLRGALLAAGAGSGAGGADRTGHPTTALVVHPDPTPPSGVTPYARPPRRRWLPVATIVALAGLVAAAVAAVLPVRHPPRRPGPGRAAAAGGPRSTSAAHPVRPEAD